MPVLKHYNLLIKSAGEALKLQHHSGAMPAGHNGLYHDPESPVRNTSHWLITFTKVYQLTGEKHFKEAATKAGRYLTTSDARPHGASFLHRLHPEKDGCNGLMGQAWTIEALAEAAHPLEMPELLKLAEEVFLLHPFSEEDALWQRVDPDGTALSYDGTFNHQLWFAAAGGLLGKEVKGEVYRRVTHFVDHLPIHLNIYENGLIYHPLKLDKGVKKVVKALFKEILKHRKLERHLRYKAIGYHHFNMYAFALLKSVFPQHDFWANPKFVKTLEYMQTKAYEQALDDNIYAFPYNPPGIEVAFALETFVKGQKNRIEEWLTKQFEHCFNFDECMMNLQTEDPLTAAARIYEATRLSNVELTLNEGFQKSENNI